MKSYVVTPLFFVLAAGLCVLGAWGTVLAVERRAVSDVSDALAAAELDWAEVRSDGLRLDLTGTAPDEATRFRAASVAGTVVSAGRVVDNMDVATRDPAAPPRFSVEMLRSDDGITLIGLIPAALDRQRLMDEVAREAFETPITDLLETASYPAPEGWDAALEFGLDALGQTERARISVAADKLGVTTMASSAAERARLDAALRRRAPEGVDLTLDISAPRPVIAPFTLRLVKEDGSVAFDACSAPDEAGREVILDAARTGGLPEDADCTLGLGVPSADWSATAARAIEVVTRLDTGALTMSGLDIRLEAGAGTTKDAFSDIAADLEETLPEEFTLTALLEEGATVEPELGPAEFTATRSPEGQVRIRGRLGTERSRSAVASFATALFGQERVRTTLDVAPEVPDGWSPRIFASLDALSLLAHGAAVVTEDDVRVSGTSGAKDAKARIAQVLATQLGETESFEIEVAYDRRIDPILALPTPEECAGQVNAILRARQITFAPGSAEIDAESRDSVDAIAEVLRKCEDVTMEVAGFTDSQGREEMNRGLSQARADALINALMARRVLTSALTAKGYGEETPIADNATEAGREANRRIEFRLLAATQAGAGDPEAPDGESDASSAPHAEDAGTDP